MIAPAGIRGLRWEMKRGNRGREGTGRVREDRSRSAPAPRADQDAPSPRLVCNLPPESMARLASLFVAPRRSLGACLRIFRGSWLLVAGRHQRRRQIEAGEIDALEIRFAQNRGAHFGALKISAGHFRVAEIRSAQ